MKTILFCAVLLMPAMAVAQSAAQQPTPPAQSPAPAAATALNGDTPIETLMGSPASKAVVDKYLPDLGTHPAYDQFKAMSLRQLEPLSGGTITDDKIAAIEGDLKKIGSTPAK